MRFSTSLTKLRKNPKGRGVERCWVGSKDWTSALKAVASAMAGAGDGTAFHDRDGP